MFVCTYVMIVQLLILSRVITESWYFPNLARKVICIVSIILAIIKFFGEKINSFSCWIFCVSSISSFSITVKTECPFQFSVVVDLMIQSINHFPLFRNAYGNTISSDTYSSHIYSNNNQSLPNLLAVPSRHTTNANSQQQQQIKSRGTVSNQVANSTVTRFPPALTPINGTNNVIQVAANSTSLNNVSNNINSIMAVNNRQQQQQYRTNLIQSGGEIIDLSSPPHSPQHMNNAVNRIPSVSNSNYSLKTNSHPNLPPLKRITDAPLMKNGVPQYKVSLSFIFVFFFTYQIYSV